jgi:hypothetical protein
LEIRIVTKNTEVNVVIKRSILMVHTFNPKHLGGRGRQISEFQASLVYRVNSRTARATQRNPVSKNKQTNKTKQQQKLSILSEDITIR